MQAYWVELEDGGSVCTEAQSTYDAALIVEKITERRVKRKPGQDTLWPASGLEIACLPYPASPVVWQLDHPVHGKCPTFCFNPDGCKGRSSCPRPIACCD